MVHLTKLVAAVLVLLAIVLGIYAWILSHRYQPSLPQTAGQTAPDPEVRAAAPLFPVVVAARATPAGQVIAADALRVAQLPIQPSGTFASAEALVGRVPVLDLSEGMPLVENQLASGLAQRLGDGERAVAVRADEVMGVGHRVQPGDYVDVFVVLKSDGRDTAGNQARLLLSRKRVLAFGAASVENMQQNSQQSQGRNEAARTAVLAIPVAEIARLALGENGGHLLLALRNPADVAQPEAALFAGLTAAHLSGHGASTPAMAAVHPAVAKNPDTATASARRSASLKRTHSNEVEFLRGDRRETLNY
ncbi:MAG: cpaB [Variovorax sp.]|nr:cpaB [Variovorax sp.]